MNIKVLDFEQVATCYKPYVEGIKQLEEKANSHREEMGKIQEEAMSLMESAQQKDDEEKAQQAQQQFQSLQQKAMMADKQFKQFADDEQRSLIDVAFKGITEIVQEHVESNKDVDIVLNRSEVVYYGPESSITDKVIEMIKSRDLYEDSNLLNNTKS